jgi:amino acid transporter
MTEATLFLRKATGLVRSWSVFDAFIYAFFSINLVTLGLYIFSQMYYLEGGLVPTAVISGLIIVAEVVVYAGLIAVMPRAGGDYVWQSRILRGSLGFVLAVTGWWFILWLWTPLYADMLRHITIVPLMGILGLSSQAVAFAWSPSALFLVCVITVIFVSVIIGLGMRSYAKVQRFCFYAGMAGLAVVFAVLLFGSREAFIQGLETQAPAMYGIQGEGLYAATIEAGASAGAVMPMMGGSLAAIFLAMPYIVFFNLWPNWGATLYGEVKGAGDFKKNLYGMGLALLITTVLVVVFLYLINKTIGWDFYMGANGAYWNTRWGYTTEMPPYPVWPYPAMLAMFMVPSPILQVIVIVAMSMWFFGWAGTVFLSSTRVIFAAAFDRVLPEAVASIEPRSRTPLWALALMVVPGLIVSYLYAFNVEIAGNGFASLTLMSTAVIAITFLGSTVAAVMLPFKKKELHDASPIAAYRLPAWAGWLLWLVLAAIGIVYLIGPWLAALIVSVSAYGEAVAAGFTAVGSLGLAVVIIIALAALVLWLLAYVALNLIRGRSLPLLTAAGLIFAEFLSYLLFEWFIDPNQLYGISYRNTGAVVFALVMYGLALVLYLGAKFYRRSRGVDLRMVYKEIPVE